MANQTKPLIRKKRKPINPIRFTQILNFSIFFKQQFVMDVLLMTKITIEFHFVIPICWDIVYQ